MNKKEISFIKACEVELLLQHMETNVILQELLKSNASSNKNAK